MKLQRHCVGVSFGGARMNKLGRLSDVEMEPMQTIWGLATPVTVAQLLAIFENSKGWKNSTKNVKELQEWFVSSIGKDGDI